MPQLEKKDSFVAEQPPHALCSAGPWKAPARQLGALLRQTTVAKEKRAPRCLQLALSEDTLSSWTECPASGQQSSDL